MLGVVVTIVEHPKGTITLLISKSELAGAKELERHNAKVILDAIHKAGKARVESGELKATVVVAPKQMFTHE